MKTQIKETLKQKGIHPNKDLRQNFLISEKVIQEILKQAEISSRDTVVEIGAGIGILTDFLSQKVKKIIAVEKDGKIAEILREKLKSRNNAEIVVKDILSLQNFPENYKVIGNLPYNIATEVIRKFLEKENHPEFMVIMLQKEVGERVISKPPHMKRLGVLTQFHANATKIKTISKTKFWPSPKVNSILLKITPKKTGLSLREECNFKHIVKAGFAHPRKQLLNNLNEGLNLSRQKIKKDLEKAGINPSQRAQSLGLEKWTKLTETLSDKL